MENRRPLIRAYTCDPWLSIALLAPSNRTSSGHELWMPSVKSEALVSDRACDVKLKFRTRHTELHECQPW